jgi:hypothetical protein
MYSPSVLPAHTAIESFHSAYLFALVLLQLPLFPLVFDDLLAPTAPLSAIAISLSDKGSYYRLGKNLSGSGIFSRCIMFASSFQAAATIKAQQPKAIAVLAFQFAGWAYQPPAGDQTCFGYLGDSRSEMRTMRQRAHLLTGSFFLHHPYCELQMGCFVGGMS